MKIIDNTTIKLDRELSALDLFVLNFIKILQNHTPYVIVSGYVSILFGRSRGTEDIDLFIKKLDSKQFKKLYKELLKKGYWALNSDSEEKLFSMLNNDMAIRFAKKKNIIPNIEVKFIKDFIDRFTLNNRVKIITKKGDLFISKIGLQIAYKQSVLKSPKDLEDARHLKKLFNITDDKINKYKRLLKEHGRI